jgi:hypothetical protein
VRAVRGADKLPEAAPREAAPREVALQEAALSAAGAIAGGEAVVVAKGLADHDEAVNTVLRPHRNKSMGPRRMVGRYLVGKSLNNQWVVFLSVSDGWKRGAIWSPGTGNQRPY